MVFFAIFVYGDSGEQEEIDFLLFSPNSSNQFVNQDQAMIQLDNLAKFLMGRNPVSGQIAVYGYAAVASNNIEPVNLSRDRALFVMSELQKRGIPKELFSDPVGYGEVDLWGGNTNEQNRSPNRRVRILLDGSVLTPSTLKAAEPEITIPIVDSTQKAAAQEKKTDESGSKFPWIILLPLLIIALLAAMIYFLTKNRRRSTGTVVPSTVAPGAVAPDTPVIDTVVPDAAAPSAMIPEIVPLAVAPLAFIPAVIPAALSYSTVNLDEEIRLRAYGLFEERNGQNGDRDGDWYKAVIEVCARYQDSGHETYPENGSWWARKPV